MKIGVSPAESVDPGIKMIADADLSAFTGYPGWSIAAGGRRQPVVWLDMETGKVVDPSDNAQGARQTSTNGLASDGRPSDKAPCPQRRGEVWR